MGEERALGEGMVFTVSLPASQRRDEYSPFTENPARMYSFHVDILKYIHLNALCYNKCKSESTLEGAFMVKGVNGEKNA